LLQVNAYRKTQIFFFSSSQIAAFLLKYGIESDPLQKLNHLQPMSQG
jgi:hypothetical protein